MKPVLIRKADKVMEAENEFHKGRAVWYFEIGTWACKQADDCLKFLMKKDVATAKRELLLRGFKWKWLDAAEKPEKGGAIAV